jgi:hypothetical protein
MFSNSPAGEKPAPGPARARGIILQCTEWAPPEQAGAPISEANLEGGPPGGTSLPRGRPEAVPPGCHSSCHMDWHAANPAPGPRVIPSSSGTKGTELGPGHPDGEPRRAGPGLMTRAVARRHHSFDTSGHLFYQLFRAGARAALWGRSDTRNAAGHDVSRRVLVIPEWSTGPLGELRPFPGHPRA